MQRCWVYPENAGKPAVLHCVIQVEVIKEVSLQHLLLFLITNPTEQHRPPCWTHGQRETRARRRLTPRGAQSGPNPLFCTQKKDSVHQVKEQPEDPDWTDDWCHTLAIFTLSLEQKHVRVDGPLLHVLFHPLKKKASPLDTVQSTVLHPSQTEDVPL